MFIENLGDRFIAAVSNTVGLNAGDGSSFFARCYVLEFSIMHLGVVNFHCMQISFVMSMRFIFGDD